jgi:HAD superfamily hydrolase (TIGR01509 family)
MNALKSIKKTKLVMFDYDGVIMDSNHCPMVFYEMLAERLGTRKFESWDNCRRMLEANYKDTLRGLGVTKENDLAIANNLFKETFGLWKNLELFPGIKETLITLKQQGYTLAIVSNNHNEVMIPDLKKHKIHDFFDHILDRSIGAKPDPVGLLECLKLTSTYADQAVMIEDMDGGLIAAKKIKLKKAIGVSYGYQLPERLTMADVIINAPEEIPKVIE